MSAFDRAPGSGASRRIDSVVRRAAPVPGATSAADAVLALQRSAGNRAVTRLLARDATKTGPKPKEEKAPVTGPRVVFPGIGEIPIESFQWGTLRSVPPPSRDDDIGKSQPTEIIITSKIGEHSPALMRASLQGEAREVEIIWPQGEGGAVLRLELKAALVSNYSLSSGGDTPTETWSLNFESVEFEQEGAAKE